jgi:hypothetical protein
MTATDWHLLRRGDRVTHATSGLAMEVRDYHGSQAVCVWGCGYYSQWFHYSELISPSRLNWSTPHEIPLRLHQ